MLLGPLHPLVLALALDPNPRVCHLLCVTHASGQSALLLYSLSLGLAVLAALVAVAAFMPLTQALQGFALPPLRHVASGAALQGWDLCDTSDDATVINCNIIGAHYSAQ